MGEHAKVVHNVRGRMRIKIPAAKRKPHLLKHIRESVAAVSGVHEVHVRSAANSLVVHYRGASPAEFWEMLAEHGRFTDLFDLAPPEIAEMDLLVRDVEREAEHLASRSELARSIVDAAKSLNSAVKRATDNNVDLKVLVPLGLAIYTLLEFDAEASTPLWVTLGIFSFTSFVSLHPPAPSAGTADTE
jgi:hypothetical protein